MNQDIDKVTKAISIAKVKLMMKPEMVFLSHVCCNLPVNVDNSISTACTDGKQILLNADFFMSLRKEQQVFLLAHETLHVVFMHMTRIGTRNPSLWNDAGDYVINAHLKENNFDLIKGALYDPTYTGLRTEQVYDLLMQDQEENSNDNGDEDGDSDSNNGDNPLKDDIRQAPSQEEQQDIENEITNILVQANQMAEMKKQGHKVPIDVQRYLTDKCKPKVDWKVVLKRFMQSLDNLDYTWKKPKKRYLNQEMYLPSLKSDGLAKLSFAIDTSGSIDESQFNQFMTEVYQVLKLLKPKELELMQFDHCLRSVDTIQSLQDIKRVVFKGHGGTEPEVALQRFIETKNSKALIVLTDGEFYTSNLTNPKRPVLWVVFNNTNFTAPFGKAIHFKL